MAAPPTAAWQTPAAAADGQAAQLAELSRRVQHLDDNNRQLHTQLAQSEQRTQVFRDEVSLLRQQLADTSQQLEQARLAEKDAQQRFAGLKASTQFRGGATLRANTNMQAIAQRLQQAGLPVLTEGDVLRIIIPSDQLFQPGTAQPQPQAAGLIDPIAGALRQHCPRQRVGIEGYVDNAPLYGGHFANSHQLTAAQTLGVLDILTARGGLPAQQLFILAQGANNPRQDNTSAAGRAANRRIEIVVYPETF